MKNILFSLLLLLSINTLVAQTGLMGYGSAAAVPSASANPALTTDARWVIGLPLISSFQLEANTSFKLAESMVKTSAGKTVLDLNRFASFSKERNYMQANMGLDLFSVGFRVKSKNFISVGMQHYSSISGTFSDDFIKLIADGNAGKPVVTLDNESLYINQFNAFYAGLSRSFMSDKLTIGARLKLIQGIGNFQTDKSSLVLQTDANSNPAYAISLTGNLQAQGGGLYGILLDSTLRKKTSENVQSNLFGMGKGVGIDIGVNFKLSDKVNLSASAVNLGNITWKQEFSRFISLAGTGNFVYSGLKKDLGAEGQTTISHDIDSVRSNFDKAFTVKTSKVEYSTALPTIFAAAVSYNINEKHQVMAMLRAQSLNGQKTQLIGFKYQFTPFRSLQLMGGMSLVTDAPASIGLGVVWSPGPFQLHLLADNIKAVTAIDNNNYAQIQMGLNIVLKKRKMAEVVVLPPQ